MGVRILPASVKPPFGSFVLPLNFEGQKSPKSPIPSAFLPMVSKVGILFGGDEEDRTLDLTDANEPTGIVCTWIWPFLAVSANNHFVFKPLVTTIFRVFREPLWYVLWSASEPRWNAPARLVCCLRVDDTSERGVRQQFSAHSNARGAMLNQGIGRVLPCCGSSRKINSGNKIKNLKTGRIIDKLALLC